MKYLVVFLLFEAIYNLSTAQLIPDKAWGVYSWGNYNPSEVNPEKTPHVKGAPLTLRWSSLEPESGRFEFDKLIRDKLIELDANEYYTTLMVWVAFATSNVSPGDTTWAFTPVWLFRSGVPLVEFPETVNPLGNKRIRYFPYYLDEDYKFYFHRMIDSLGSYVCSLPPHLRERILFIQSAEGSTGDGSPYKGLPIDPAYNISKEEWSRFRIETWEKYLEAFSVDGKLLLPLVTNYDSNEEEQYEWMLEKLPKTLGLKNGMFSHGYHISEAQERLANYTEFRDEVESKGKILFSRGEQDAEWRTYGWSTQNSAQAFYWSALYATHCGLSLWNIHLAAAQREEHFPAFILFNRYANQVHPETADYAFCALRRGLDASDTLSFPESTYGEATKSNTKRYVEIVNDFKSYGAQMGDPEKATGGGMINRKRQDYNDAGWKILTGNYRRHFTQIEPEETSAAWWSVDKSIYGRFARGFEPASQKDSMFFDLDDRFYGEQFLQGQGTVKVKITYRDGDPGSWKLLYDAADGTIKTAIDKTNKGTGNAWKTVTVVLDDAYLGNRGPRRADFILVNTGGTNCRFHMIEIERNGKPGTTS